MKRAARLPAFLGLLLLAAVAYAQARGATIYIQRVLVADPGDIRLVQTAGEAPVAAGETLALTVATVSRHLIYIPSRSYMDQVENVFGRDSIFVGSRTIVIPRGAVPEASIPLVDRLVDFLTANGVLAGDVADIDIRSIQSAGTLPQGAAPSFQMVRSSKTSVEVTFSAAAEDDQSSGRILLGLKEDARAAVAGLRAGDSVQVIFHKGPITIEMQGKAQMAAAVGDTVSVLVTDSRRTFSGRLLAGKAVDVELP
jgi:Chaperone for flagella basal body P-ring formation